jgi:hypothetical protein
MIRSTADMKKLQVLALSSLLVVSIFGCDKLREKPPEPYEIVIHVESDPGKPVEEASILLGANKVASTNATGTAELKLRGEEGETLMFGVQCPPGHQNPKPTSVTLRRISDPSKRPEYQVACPPQTRTVVVAVRADEGPNLPVVFLGRELTRTDASGAAHLTLRMRPDESFQLMLKTSDSEEGSRLRPQDPVATFRVKHHDEVMTFNQEFKVERRPTRWVGRPTGPTPLKTH